MTQLAKKMFPTFKVSLERLAKRFYWKVIFKKQVGLKTSKNIICL